MLVVGTVIGSGIWLTPSNVLREVGSPAVAFAVWIAGGVLTLAGALVYAELGASLPHAGGQYVFLRESTGRFIAFLFGWAFFLVIATGSAATLAVAFARYFAYLVPMPVAGEKAVAAAVVMVLTVINCRGVRLGASVQNVATLLKLGAMAVLALAAVAVAHPAPPQAVNTLAAPVNPVAAFGVGLVAVLWAYEGWYYVTFAAGEIDRPARNVPFGLLFGTVLVIAAYLIMNWTYLAALSPREMAQSTRVAVSAATRLLGRRGATFITLAILVSTFSALNGLILTGPRTYFAMARDGLFFRRAAEVHPRFETPVWALMIQAVWSVLLAVSGSFEQLFTYVIFGAWAFFGLTAFGAIRLRRQRPTLPRPYRMWGYPIMPWLFILASAGIVVNTLFTRPLESLIGLGIMATGIPVYYLFKARDGRNEM